MSREEYSPEDASKYLYESKKQALDHLFPNPDEMDKRMSLITILRGRAPNMYELYLAAVEWEGWLAMEERRAIKWDHLDPIMFLREHAPSINGLRSKQAVEIARAAPVDGRESVMDRIKAALR